ncbi:proteasome assembly chaperone 4-like [Ruditapes philippinarum]|uniref:proteasome assembly chaperone 4-like n=1 Tax=Ruditapes philippinarum TaxID=129788 RepID=UPI00295A68EE|nr:proteasome assembly chaperone 4-like [Ruditapes philippinarum]
MEDVKLLEPTVYVHVFSDKILDQDVFFQVIKLQDSFYLWFGKSNQFGDLSVAMATLKNVTSSTNLIGGSESHSVAMAERLSKKLKKQVFIGGDISCFSQLQLPLLEQRIAEEIQCNPDKF